MKFVFVDSDDKNSLFWEMNLKMLYKDAEVVMCPTGAAALAACEKGAVDFFISAWEIEPMSGLIFMQKIREIKKFRRSPFLLISQVLQEADIALAKEFGIQNYLLKPFDKDSVKNKIESMLQEEKNLDETQRTLRKIEDYLNENKPSEGLKLIQPLLKSGPHAARAYTLMGEIWARTDQPEKAEKSFKDAIKYDENYAAAHSGLANLYMKIGKKKEGIELFETMNQRWPKNIQRMLNLGNAYLDVGEKEKAKNMFQEIDKMDTNNHDAKAGFGKVAFAEGNFDVAAKFFRESGKGEELATYFNNLGIKMVSHDKQYLEAVTVYTNALKVLPTKDKHYLLEYNIGLALRKADKIGEATNAFARCLIAAPGYDKAASALAHSIDEATAKKQKFDATLIEKAKNYRKEFKLKNSAA